MRRERQREWGFEVKSVGDCVCSVNSALWGTQTSESELEMRRIWIIGRPRRFEITLLPFNFSINNGCKHNLLLFACFFGV